ncbi:efflux RND transporter permease subunit [Vibrio sp. SNU_ST1]|uniref:efflux RND transporter permease subunit n=1 Tax=Vibrio sp. SNU_ST1 TaxID=3064001 RepID=UPI002729A388|nr:efflux RND transporter permease subunit [Vibrio sp. SNU_ST1]WKY60158.1 efflux RND transporter permease subunit [Vibrio sp. SNU_ST1]
MPSIIAYFAQRSFLARIVTIMVLMLGAASMYTLKLQEYPDVAFETVEIETSYPGATAQDIELNITNPIEKELRSVQGLNYFSSQSSDGISYIEAELLPGEDAAKVLRDIQQAVDRVSNLPKDITAPPVVTQKQTSSFEVLTFGVSLNAAAKNDGANLEIESSSSESLMSESLVLKGLELENSAQAQNLQQYAYQLEKRVNAVAGVSSVSLSGYNEREFWVEIAPEKISRYQLTFDEVSQAINRRNLSQSGGVVESWVNEQKIVTMTQVHSAQEIADIVIKALPNGSVIKVSDVATVEDTFARASQLGVINGEEAVLFSITNSASADIIATVDNVKALLEKEQAKVDGQYHFQYGLNLADDMNDKFSIVSTNGAIGLVLVLAVLSLILKRQVAFWVSMSIPFCILGVMIVLPAVGLNLDSITLAALLLVIGIIVDDSVIVAESIYQEKEQGKTALQAAISGTQRVIKPIIASLTTTALVFIPMFFIPGTMGKVVVVIPITVIAALLFSLAECTFTLPAHLSGALESKKSKNDNHNSSEKNRFSNVSRTYKAWLTNSIQYKKSVIAGALVASALSAGLVTTLKLDIFPAEAAKYIDIYTEVDPGTPLDKVRDAHLAIEEAIAALPSNERVSYNLSYASPVSTGLLILTSYEQRARTADQIIVDLNTQLADLQQDMFVKFSVDAGGPPPGEPIEMRVLGGTEQERNHAVTIASEWLSTQHGIAGVTNNEALKDPQLSIVPQYEWLAKYNLTVSDLATTLRLAFEGESVTSTWLGDQEVDIRVILEKEYRDIQRLATTKIFTPDGRQVPLSRLAKVKQIEAPRLIKHYNAEREVTVTAQITDDTVSSVVLSDQMLSELQGQYAQNVSIDIGGEAESTNETMSGFLVAFPAAMIAIYFVLAVMFNSLVQPLLVMAVIPFAVIAALMALVVHMQALSMFALIGVLGMTGVVVNNSLVLINRINELRAEGHPVIEAIIEASVSRLRPILLTSITTVVGLLPLAYGLGGTDVYMGPMSLTLGYGLLFSLPIVLFVIPSLCGLCFAKSQPKES